MNKKIRWSLGSVAAAGALGAAVLLPATGASAAEDTTTFSCPADTDTIQVPYGFADDATPLLAGTVCVETGTTIFDSLNVTPGWTAQVRSDGSNDRTEVRFAEPETRDRVELRYEPGKTEIK